MGIPEIQKRILEPANTKIRGIITDNAPHHINTLWVDANAVIHRAAGIVCGYDKTSRQMDYDAALSMTEEDRDKAIIDKSIGLFQDYIQKYTPNKLVIIAFDGVVPTAKINQQRTRRYLNAHNLSKPPQQGETFSQLARRLFNTAKVTPGTMFMEKLDKEIMAHLPNLNVLSAQYELIYSSYRDRGEGEHKIISLMKQGILLSSDVHLIISADSDLVMLAANVGIKNLYLFRDIQGIYFDANTFDYYITTEWGTDSIKDFLLLVEFLGNDFIPPQPSMFPGVNCVVTPHVKTSNFKTIQEVYKEVIGNERVVDAEGEINWELLHKIVNILAEQEYRRLQTAHKIYNDPEDPRWSAVVFPTNTTQVSEEDEKKYMELFRTAWYAIAFPDMSQEERIEQIKNMTKEYLKGMAWTLRYYLFGIDSVSAEWTYPYRYAPLFQDLASLSWDDFTTIADEIVSNPQQVNEEIAKMGEQFLMTIPTASLEEPGESNENSYITTAAGVQELNTYYFPDATNVKVDYLGIPEEVREKELSAVLIPPITPEDVREITTTESLASEITKSMEEDDIEIEQEEVEGTARNIHNLYVEYLQTSVFTSRPTEVLMRNRQYIEAKAVETAVEQKVTRRRRAAPRA